MIKYVYGVGELEEARFDLSGAGALPGNTTHTRYWVEHGEIVCEYTTHGEKGALAGFAGWQSYTTDQRQARADLAALALLDGSGWMAQVVLAAARLDYKPQIDRIGKALDGFLTVRGLRLADGAMLHVCQSVPEMTIFVREDFALWSVQVVNSRMEALAHSGPSEDLEHVLDVAFQAALAIQLDRIERGAI